MNNNRDTLYAQTISEPAAFAFDSSVADVFSDMIERSVPGYATIISMTGLLAARYASPGSQLYDLGCSLGASSLSMQHNISHSDCKIIGVDNSEAMIQRCKERLASETGSPPIQFMLADIEDVTIHSASMAVLNFTLQFVSLEKRARLLDGIYQGLEPGGVLVLSEKVSFEDPHLNQLNIDLHHEFKRANGYSDLEIAQKRTALEDVLIPETLNTHKQRLREVGFSSVDVWFQCFNFASLVALK